MLLKEKTLQIHSKFKMLDLSEEKMLMLTLRPKGLQKLLFCHGGIAVSHFWKCINLWVTVWDTVIKSILKLAPTFEIVAQFSCFHIVFCYGTINI